MRPKYRDHYTDLDYTDPDPVRSKSFKPQSPKFSGRLRGLLSLYLDLDIYRRMGRKRDIEPPDRPMYDAMVKVFQEGNFHTSKYGDVPHCSLMVDSQSLVNRPGLLSCPSYPAMHETLQTWVNSLRPKKYGVS